MAYEQPLRIDQGSRFQWIFGITTLSLATLPDAKMQVRSGKHQDATLLLDASSYVRVDTGANQVIIDIPGSATASADWIQGQYDIKVYKASDVTVQPVRIAQGLIVLDREVTV